MDLTDIGQIRAVIKRHGFRPSKSMGQNFLTESWVPERIAACAGLDENTGVLEVGPGIGCLTAQLSKRAGKVVAVELDRALEPILRETLSDRGNVELVFGDALKLDLKKLAAERLQGLRPVVCANLPYNATSPLLSAFIGAGCFEDITVMVQLEVARRICAPAGTGDCGAFGIYVQWRTEPELLFKVGPECFTPRPKVTSAVIRLKKRAAPPAETVSEEIFFRTVRAAFNQRRKTLANALSSGLGLSREQAAYAVEKCGFDPKIRGEAVGIGGFAKISDEIAAILNYNL